jgi:hypothetical protein
VTKTWAFASNAPKTEKTGTAQFIHLNIRGQIGGGHRRIARKIIANDCGAQTSIFYTFLTRSHELRFQPERKGS